MNNDEIKEEILYCMQTSEVEICDMVCYYCEITHFVGPNFRNMMNPQYNSNVNAYGYVYGYMGYI